MLLKALRARSNESIQAAPRLRSKYHRTIWGVNLAPSILHECSDVALGLAGFARAHLALLLPLAAFYLLESSDPKEFLAQIRRRFWMCTPVLAGSVLLVTIIAIVREHNLAIDPPPIFRGPAHTFQFGCLSAVPGVSYTSFRLLADASLEV